MNVFFIINMQSKACQLISPPVSFVVSLTAFSRVTQSSSKLNLAILSEQNYLKTYSDISMLNGVQDHRDDAEFAYRLSILSPPLGRSDIFAGCQPA